MPDRAPPRFSMLPWFPSDFMGATRTWPFIARAIYRELLDFQWCEGSIPADETDLRRALGVNLSQWREGWPYVRTKFVTDAQGRLRNPRLEAHRAESQRLYERHRAGADKTNRRRMAAVVSLRKDNDG